MLKSIKQILQKANNIPFKVLMEEVLVHKVLYDIKDFYQLSDKDLNL